MDSAVDSDRGEMRTKFDAQSEILMSISTFPKTFLTMLEKGLSDEEETLGATVSRSINAIETLRKVDRDRIRLQIKVDRLLDEMTALRAYPPDGAIAPVHRLSAEVLTQIFVFVLPERVYPRWVSSPLALSHVCSTWRGIALTYSLLWNRLSIDVFCHSRPRVLSSMMTSWFNRANNPHPLSLSLENHISFGRVAEDITLGILPLLPRLSELRLETVNLQNLTSLLSLASGRMPLLETLVLNADDVNSESELPITLFGSAPRLHTVILGISSQIVVDGPDFLFPWEQLTCLNIERGISLDAFSVIIFKCIHLQTASFTISSQGDVVSRFPYVPFQLVTFINLSVLKIKLDNFDDQSSLRDVLSMTDLPAIHTLSVESNPGSCAFPLNAIQFGRRDSLESIRSLVVLAHLDTQPELFELISACTLLETLTLRMQYGLPGTSFLKDFRTAIEGDNRQLVLSHLTSFSLHVTATATIQSTVCALILFIFSLIKVRPLKTVSLLITDAGDNEDVRQRVSVALYDLRQCLWHLIHPNNWGPTGWVLHTKVLIGAQE